MINHFEIEAKVIINKYDLNENMADKIESFCQGKGIEVLSKIPFSPLFVDLLREGKLIVEEKSNSKAARLIGELWNEIVKI